MSLKSAGLSALYLIPFEYIKYLLEQMPGKALTDKFIETLLPWKAAYNRKMNRPDGAGASWSEEEDKQLDDEFNTGMKISEMAKCVFRSQRYLLMRMTE